MSVWEKVYKNPKMKTLSSLAPNSVIVPGIKLPKRAYQLPSLYFGIAVGTSFTKRTVLCQLGSELMKWNPEKETCKQELSVFRVEKVINDMKQEIALGEEALSNFMSDRGDPSCTLFFQPLRYLISAAKMGNFVTTYEGQKIRQQSPTNEDIFQHYIKAQFKYLWDNAHQFFSEMKRFQVGQMIFEYPDYFADGDICKYKNLAVEAAKDFFPPVLSPEEETGDLKERITFLPESVMTLLHWLTDNIECKLAAPEVDLKKLLVKHGILPRTTDPVNVLVVTMGATHSRVVKLKLSSINHIASAKRVGETVPIYHNYLGRTGFGGDHISCAFLEEEEERRFGASAAHKVSTFNRKVMEDWGKMTHPEGKKHFEELYGKQFTRAIEKLGELTFKGFSENPENTIVLLGGKVFTIPFFRDKFRDYINSQRVPLARIVYPSTDNVSIDKVSEILQYHRRGLGRLFTVKIGVDAEGAQRFNWRIGKVVEGTLVDTLIDADGREWDEKSPREFKLTLERGVMHVNLGYQKTSGGISQMWARVSLKKTRVLTTINLTFKTEGPGDLSISAVKADGNVELTPDDFQVDMLISGERPTHFPLYDRLLKSGM